MTSANGETLPSVANPPAMTPPPPSNNNGFTPINNRGTAAAQTDQGSAPINTLGNDAPAARHYTRGSTTATTPRTKLPGARPPAAPVTAEATAEAPATNPKSKRKQRAAGHGTTAAQPTSRRAPDENEEEGEHEDEVEETAVATRRNRRGPAAPTLPASKNNRQNDVPLKKVRLAPPRIEDLQVRAMPCTVCVTRLSEGRASACYYPKSVGSCCYECGRLNHTAKCIMPAENLQAPIQDWYNEVLVFTKANKALSPDLHQRGIRLVGAIRESRKETAAAAMPAVTFTAGAPATASTAHLLVPGATPVVTLDERVAIAQERQAVAAERLSIAAERQSIAAEQLVTLARIANKTAKGAFDEVASQGKVLKRMEGIMVSA
ncbi:hypothetical protein BT67DRAFT_155971 [Trichocladium antarcticum]|uniref:Uncharacterized protein n=1 Tax=Trichocladium antarcticum TaxID=1450529 RepID=A0AAN6UET4_9PEZI|nr:hypothetical protein BT67DRAFT_155971 [Trichocladium antarcticum]